MTIKQTNDGAAAVNTELFWIPVADVPPPNGPKLLLINKQYGVAVLGSYTKSAGWTHWQALPKFPKENNEY